MMILIRTARERECGTWRWITDGQIVEVIERMGWSYSCSSWQWDHVLEMRLRDAHCKVWLCDINSHITIPASRMGGHLSTLDKCMQTYSHTHARRGVNYLHHTLLFYSNSWLAPWKTSGIDRSMQLGTYTVAAAVCVCVCSYSAYEKKGVHLLLTGSTLPAVIF